MRRMIVAAVFLIGLTTMAGRLEWEMMAEKTDLEGREAPMSLTILSAGRAYAQQTVKSLTYADVDAIFSKYHCTVCHGGDDPRAGLSLETHSKLLKGGKGGPVVIPGNPGKSELVLRLKGLSEPRMPYTGPPWLADEEIGTIEQWIAAGAIEGR
jgi:hypothetical protein